MSLTVNCHKQVARLQQTLYSYVIHLILPQSCLLWQLRGGKPFLISENMEIHVLKYLQSLARFLGLLRRRSDYFWHCTVASGYLLDETNHSNIFAELHRFRQLRTLFDTRAKVDFILHAISIRHPRVERNVACLYHAKLHA
jgi:hypothetical protein